MNQNIRALVTRNELKTHLDDRAAFYGKRADEWAAKALVLKEKGASAVTDEMLGQLTEGLGGGGTLANYMGGAGLGSGHIQRQILQLISGIERAAKQSASGAAKFSFLASHLCAGESFELTFMDLSTLEFPGYEITGVVPNYLTEGPDYPF